MSLVPVTSNAPSFYEITPDKAFSVQETLIREWKPQREVWALRYGDYMTGIFSGISGVTIDSIFRKKLKLRHNGLIFTQLSMSIPPAFLAYICHTIFIKRSLLLYKSECPLCLYVRGVSLMTLTSIAFPLLGSPAVNLIVASNLGYRVPSSTEIRDILRFWWSTVKPASNRLLTLTLSNFVFANIMIYKEIKERNNMLNIILKVNEKLENETIKRKNFPS